MLLPVFLFALFQIAVILTIAFLLYRRKRAGQWKRPWSFPVAMGLLGFALCLSLSLIVRFALFQFGK